MGPDLLRPFRGLPGRFWVLWGATLLNRLGGFVVPFLALFLVESRGITAAEIGSILALFGAGSVLGGPLGGLAADHFGRRTTLAVGMLASALAMGALIGAHDVSALMPATFAVGLAMELPRPATAAMVADLVPDADRPRAYAALYWAINIGFACASVIAGFVARLAFEWLFLVDALTCVGCAAVIWLALPETMPLRSEVRPRFSPRDLAIPFRDGSFVIFFAASLLVALVFFQFHVAMPLDMKLHGVSTHEYGLLVALNAPRRSNPLRSQSSPPVLRSPHAPCTSDGRPRSR